MGCSGSKGAQTATENGGSKPADKPAESGQQESEPAAQQTSDTGNEEQQYTSIDDEIRREIEDGSNVDAPKVTFAISDDSDTKDVQEDTNSTPAEELRKEENFNAKEKNDTETSTEVKNDKDGNTSTKPVDSVKDEAEEEAQDGDATVKISTPEKHIAESTQIEEITGMLKEKDSKEPAQAADNSGGGDDGAATEQAAES